MSLSILLITKERQVHQNLKMEVRKFATTPQDTELLDETCDNLYEFTRVPETKAEEEYLLAKLMSRLEAVRKFDYISDNLVDEIVKFIDKSFVPKLDKLSNRNFKGVMQSDLSHNCHTESGNAALSSDVFGPKPKARTRTVNHRNC